MSKYLSSFVVFTLLFTSGYECWGAWNCMTVNFHDEKNFKAQHCVRSLSLSESFEIEFSWDGRESGLIVLEGYTRIFFKFKNTLLIHKS